jgi:hypothetical protein
LGDIAPHVLRTNQLAGLREAKRRAVLREQAEARIPKHLLYTKGWPTTMPTHQEAALLSEVRRSIADIMQFSIQYREADAILERYAELLASVAAKGQRSSGHLEIEPVQQQFFW